MNHKFKVLWTFSKGTRLKYLAAVFCVLATVMCSYISPLVLGWTVDGVLRKQPLDAPQFILNLVERMGGTGYLAQNLWICALVVLLLTVVRGIFTFFNGRYVSVASENIVKKIKDRLYDHLQHLPYDYHVKAETGDLIQRCTTDVETVRRFLAGQMMEIARVVFILFFALGVLLAIHWQLALLSLCLMPFAAGYSYYYTFKIQDQYKLSDEADGAVSNVLQENLTGMRVVRAFGREKFEQNKFEKSLNNLFTKTIKLQYMIARFWALEDCFAMAQQALVLFVSIFFIINGGLSVGMFLVFNSYVGMMVWPIRNSGRILADAAKLSIAMGRINEILTQQPEPEEPEALKPSIAQDIVFDHVTFGYEADKPVLRDVSFTIKQGESVAVMGPTGSGKSSLVHLLQRLYDYQQGSIRIGGVELRDIDRYHLRSRVGIVLQEPFLYSKTIRENIGIIHEQPEELAVVDAARVAAVHDVIMDFEKKYDTLVGERGVTLSGGQKQRVAIARTLMKDSDVLIFDDSLSAVDTETDMAIRKALNERRKGVTTIIVSHRVATVAEADHILVLEDGIISQEGTHQQLLEQEGLYKRVWHIQNALEEEMEAEFSEREPRPQGA